MNRIPRSLFLVVIALFAGSLLRAATPTPTTTSNTGVLIYKLKFDHLSGFNIDFWEAGFLVVPGIGGTGTVVLTGKNDFGGQTYSQFPDTAYFFQAKRKDGSRYSVVQMTGGTIGTISPLVGMQAYGKAHGTIAVECPTFTLRVQAATSLHGLAMASLDESLIPATTTTTGTPPVTTPNPARPTDGTLGYIEFAEMKIVIDTTKTNAANKAGLGVADAVAQQVVADLTLKGFIPAVTTTTP